MRPEWTGWQLPSWANALGTGDADEHEGETEVEELPAIGENEPLLLPEDQDGGEWLLPEEDALSSAASQSYGGSSDGLSVCGSGAPPTPGA